MRCALVSWLLLSACGRFGYDELTERDAADDVDASADATTDADDPDARIALTCGTAVRVRDFGPAVAASFHGLDVAATATGFVAVWSAGSDQIRSTGIAVSAGPTMEVIQASFDLTGKQSATLSLAAIGDDLMLGVDDPDGPGIWLFALDEQGLIRSTTKYIDTHRAYGHAFVTADAANDLFVVMGSDGAATASFTRDHDIHPRSGPTAAFPIGTESAGAALAAGGYVLMTGNSSNCDVARVDGAFALLGTAQPIAMTCHNASLIAAPSSPNVVAGWNCDNDAVWVTAGDPSMTLPAYRAIAGDATDSASNPRLAATSAGVWYAYQVSGGRIGRTLLDASGATVTNAEPAVVHTSAAIKAYDLAVHGDTAFLFWLESAVTTELWTMKLCAP